MVKLHFLTVWCSPNRRVSSSTRKEHSAAAVTVLAGLVALSLLVARRPSLRHIQISISPFSAKWSQASSADSRFLASLQPGKISEKYILIYGQYIRILTFQIFSPDADAERDADFKRALYIKNEPRSSFTHGPTRVSLGPAAVRTMVQKKNFKSQSSIVALYSKHTRALAFESLYQLCAPWPPSSKVSKKLLSTVTLHIVNALRR